jgi:plasmid stabilization system protein ParE
MKPVEFHPDAAEEASEAAAYYEDIRGGLGTDFQAELNAALARIGDNPLMYAAESGTIRVCPLHRFPYSVFYEDLPDRVWIAAVGHHRRRPGYWARRRPN